MYCRNWVHKSMSIDGRTDRRITWFQYTPPLTSLRGWCHLVPLYCTTWCPCSIAPVLLLNLIHINQIWSWQLKAFSIYLANSIFDGNPWCPFSTESVLLPRPIPIPTLKSIAQSVLELLSEQHFQVGSTWCPFSIPAVLSPRPIHIPTFKSIAEEILVPPGATWWFHRVLIFNYHLSSNQNQSTYQIWR